MAMLGREVLLPASLIARPPVEPANTIVPFVKDLRDIMRDAHEQIRQATKKEARTQRKYYDDRSRMTRFYEGQKVWLYWPKPPVRQQFKKLTRLWTGPWKIMLFKSPVVVELRHVSNGATQVVHVDRLLPCVSPSAIGDRRNQTLSSWIFRTQVLRLPGDPLEFGNSQLLWNHIFLAETLRSEKHNNSCIITKV